MFYNNKLIDIELGRVFIENFHWEFSIYLRQMDADPSHPLSASSRTPLESDNPDDWKPYKDPETALREAQKNIAQDDW